MERSEAEAKLLAENPRAVVLSAHEKEFDPAVDTWMEQVGDKPLVYYFHNFLSKAEVKHMLRVAAPQIRRSSVVGDHGQGVIDDIRTSFGMFISRMQDAVVEKIERRIALWTQTPLEYQEDIQVLRYTIGQKYGAHYDSDVKDDEGFRQYTFYIYLSDTEEGGETAFPEGSEWSDPALGDALKGNGWSKCAEGHVAAKPHAGDAALFYSFHRNGSMDPASMHTGCPVIRGVKWGAPVWVHAKPFRPHEMEGMGNGRYMARPPEPGLCQDRHPRCPEWVKSGECERNKAYMMGGAASAPDMAGGMCAKSCGACTVCESEHDLDCLNKNRKRLGYWEYEREELKWLGIDLFSEAQEAAEAQAALKRRE